MGYLAKELDGGLRITAFQLTIGRAHTAERVESARRANGLASTRSLANFLKFSEPALFEAAVTKVRSILVRDDADGHAANGIYRATSMATTARISFGTQRLLRKSDFLFGALPILCFARRIAKIEEHSLFR